MANNEKNKVNESKEVNGQEVEAVLHEEKNLEESHRPDKEEITDDIETLGEIESLRKQLEEKENELTHYIDMLQRTKAEFENFRKRSSKEREQLFTDISGDIIGKFLPAIDNLERALTSASESDDVKTLSDGVKMILKQFKEVLEKEGVEEIEASGKEFDPNYHNAIMHVEDEAYDENMVIEVFQKGYRIKDKVIRYSMVKVAN